MPAPEPLRLSYLVLFCADLEASVRFYRDGLGLIPATSSPRFALLEAGPVRLGLHAGSSERRTHGVNLHFDVPDLDAAVREVVARGIRFGGEPTDEPWGARVVRAEDPDGNAVELVEWRHDG